jgi:Ras-like protein family protein 11A
MSINISTALTVRFLTKRYIGEYDHQADKVHKHEILVDTEAVLVEIWDTCMVSKYLISLNLKIFRKFTQFYLL